MGYIGAVGPAYDPTRATVPQFDAERFSGNNSAVAFTLLRQVVSPTDVDVFVENVRQEPIVAYSIVNGNILTFTEAPQTGTNNIYVIYRGSGMSNYAFVPDGSISYAKLANNIRQFNVDNFTANGTGQTFTLSETPATANTVIAAIDGVVQTAPSNYNVSGSTIIFTSAPAASANVTVRHLGFRTTATVTALSASSVTATELADGAVTNAKLAGSITSDKLVSVNGSLLIANTVANSAIQTGSIENYLRSQTLDFGMRNRIINGAMRIDQRNAGASITPTDGQIYTLDRWFSYCSVGSKISVQQDSSSNTVAGFTSSLKVTSLAATTVSSSDYYTVGQVVEGFNWADLNWGTANAKPVTLSFWVRSSLTGTFSISLRNDVADRSYPANYTINSANTWEQKTITVLGPTDGTWLKTNGAGLWLWFSLGVGSTFSTTTGSWANGNFTSTTGSTQVVATNGATFYITGVQLEEGSVPTPFEYRQYGTELALCQRYYAKIGPSTSGIYPGFGTAGGESSTAAFGVFTTPVTMRSTPTFSSNGTPTLYSNGFSNITSFGTAYYTTDTVAININVSGGGLTVGRFYNILSNNDATSFVQFNSEL